MKRYPPATRAVLLVGLAACTKAESAPLYEKVPVERRDITVAATAPGVIQPLLTLSVKSKAWGEILALPVQTGDEVQKGQLLAKIDPRIPRDNLSQAQANLDKARAQLENATAQLKRSEALYQSQAIAETDYESAKLAYATAASAVATAEANLQTAKDAMEDTQVRAPITGTVLELDAVLHTVISSPNLGGGTVLTKPMTYQRAGGGETGEILSGGNGCRSQSVPTQIDWVPIAGTANIRFHVRWENQDPINPSDPINMDLRSQPLGVFLPDYADLAEAERFNQFLNHVDVWNGLVCCCRFWRRYLR